MTPPRERIEADVKSALKAGEKERLATLRMLLSEIKNEQIRLGATIDDTVFAGLVRKAIKQRHESAEQFRRGSRAESAAKEEREAVILETYLPQQAGEDEIRAAIERLVAAEGLAGPAALGRVMPAMLAQFGPRADGATINRVARAVLSP